MATLSDNRQWVADHHDKTIHGATSVTTNNITLAADEEHTLRSLGVALIMRWSTLPQKLQRELLEDAESQGELSDATVLRSELTRLLHSNKGNQLEPPNSALTIRSS